jgi:phosphoribosylanthranilate isomerase
VSTRVKICGLTRPEDAALAAAAGASAIGLVFWPGSPRAVTVERAREVAAAVSAEVSVIGVFVDQPLSLVGGAAERVPLHAIQLHGAERPEDYDLGLPILKAIGVAGGSALDVLEAMDAGVLPLLDAGGGATPGGTGRTVDWTLAAEAAARRRVVLAGGLTPDNVGEAVRTVRPHAVDVSSGVEQTPGVKDADKLVAFLDAVRSASGVIPRGLP